jgi:CheY-like chemotaxis protein
MKCTIGSVLIVEDDIDIRESLQTALEIEGYSAVSVENGLEAVQLLEQGDRPCLILLDMMMPVMNGWEFLQHQQGKSSDISSIPVIVVSAAGDRAKPLPALNYLKKPIELEKLLSLVAKYCSHLSGAVV